MAGSSARNRAEKMMAYRMASRSTKKETYTSQVPREFGCGIRRVITSARSSSQNNRRISAGEMRSEEHTSELQSQSNLVCRLLLEKKKIYKHYTGRYCPSSVRALLPTFPERRESS